MTMTQKSLKTGQVLKMGEAELTVGKTIHELRDCNSLLGNFSALNERMAEDGYLLIRGFHPEDEVLSARRLYTQSR